jgi:diguanylate cyclase (GGDEF)-like protein
VNLASATPPSGTGVLIGRPEVVQYRQFGRTGLGQVDKIDGTDGTTGSPPAKTPSLVGSIARWSRVTLSFAAVLTLLGVLVVANQVYFAPRVRLAIDAARDVREIHEVMLEQQTALRGYLLSGDTSFSEAFESSHSRLPGLIEAAQPTLERIPGADELVLEMQIALTAWTDDWTGDALDAGAAVAAGERVTYDALLERGRELFDAYSAARDELLARLIDNRSSAVDLQSDAILATALAAGVVTVVAGAVTLRRAHNLRRAVEGPLEGLLGHLSAIRARDFGPQPDVGGPEELWRIGAGLQDASRALALAERESRDHLAQIETQNRQLGQVLRLAREVAGSMSLRDVLRCVSDAASAIADDRRVLVWLRQGESDRLEPVADSTGPGLRPVGVEAVSVGEGVVGRAARFGRVERRSSDEAEAADEDDVAVPMVVGTELIGAILVCGDGTLPLAESTIDVLETLAVQAGSAVASARHHAATETMAMTDGLTQLLNRRRLDLDLGTEIGVSTRHGRPLGFALVDIDHFKAYNDTLGHQAADVALRELAQLLRKTCRTGDTVYRYGGEELAVVMRETTADDGCFLAERLRGVVEHYFADPSQPRRITVSIGVASIPEHGTTAAEIIAAADEALYRAKSRGRNQVCRAPLLTRP